MIAAAMAFALALSGCTPQQRLSTRSRSTGRQGTEENIASLTEVIRRNPSDP
jgi:hypothetical protein